MKKTKHLLLPVSMLFAALCCCFSAASFAQIDAITIENDGSIEINGFGKNPFVPKGTIVMWYGDENTIPDGWALCNGSRPGIPDLSGRFVQGYKELSTQKIGHTGGKNRLYKSDMPAHSHRGTTYQDGNHVHYWEGYSNRCWCADGEVRSREEDTGDAKDAVTKNDGEHAHNFTTEKSGTALFIDNRPIYMVLAYIIKL